ncbi:response regulator [Sphingobium sp. AR-3-1]|uniref:Response regulator n=1 Tax=Sphingobium psychrophilum TaxID=2728834 RepID=A0A7X9X0F7_9SPHN|nr:response regulator [Sphingobium psychrophilum]NML13287.1 response regulator [Sphingobium psychrophilum]
MTSDSSETRPKLRIYCVEDNPLIVFHIEHLIEEAGHVLVGFADSFSQLKGDPVVADIDGALVDIDLADGRTGPDAAAWLKQRGIPSIFVTGQQDVADIYADRVVAVVIKPIVADEFAHKISLLCG